MAETVSYAYDEAGRLVGVSYGDGRSVTYLYDAAGNLLRRTVIHFSDPGGNGIDDAWEIARFGAAGIDPHDDPDGDGKSNLEEFQSGTDPNDPDDYLRVTRSARPDATSFRIEWASVPGKIYRIQYSHTLSAHEWFDLGGDVIATGTTTARSDVTAAGADSRFYRLVVLR